MGGTASGWWLAVLGVQIASAVGVVYVSAFSALGAGRLAGLLALRLATVGVLLLILFKPALLVVPIGGEARPTMVAAVDRSGSMALADGPGGRQRWEQVRQMLASQRERLADRIEVVYLPFARSAEAVRDFGNLPERTAGGEAGETTDLAAAIERARSATDPAGRLAVLVVSDGNHNAGSDPLAAARSVGSPVHAVGVGRADQPTRARPGVRVVRVEAPLASAVNHATELTVGLAVTGQAGGQVRLIEGDDPDPSAVASYAAGEADDGRVEVTLPWTPRDRGGQALRKLTVRADPQAGEVETRDNALELHVLVTDPQLRVLYVEGALRPEYKYLRRLLAGDPNVQFVGLVRVSGNRFWAQGEVAGRSLEALPATAGQFGLFDVILLGDLDSSFPSRSQQGLLRQWVRDGGGLAMLGGANSFGPGGYGGTEVEAALPVFCGARSEAQIPGRFVPQLTSAGRRHPIFAGIEGFFPGPGGSAARSRVALPALRGCVAVPGPKSGASVLAVHPQARGSQGPRVVLAVQSFGAGRSAALTADTTWQWYLPMRAMGADSPYERFWGQLVRWLAGSNEAASADAAHAVLRLPRTHAKVGDEPMAVRARVLLPKDQAGAELRAAVKIVETETDRRELVALSPAGRGLFEGQYRPSRPGRFTAKLTVSRAGQIVATDELPLEVTADSRETEQVARNVRLLDRLAEAGGGRSVDLAQLPDLLDDLLAEADRLRYAGRPMQTVHRLYDFPLLLVLAVVLLTAEWLLRRNWQMQ